jgi:NADH-ubiquinone oxidoreductase chain 5
MAAPTPVSSLVHSSTLVTAGVYLIIRIGSSLFFSKAIFGLLVIGLTTIIIAGMRALFEIDIKKIVALSTLSQLGLIVCAIGMRLPWVAFFHLLTHAYFKALLFISVGNIIHLSGSFQDLRVIRNNPLVAGPTRALIVLANIRLCGTPFIAGFYSKDLIIELGALLINQPGTFLLLLVGAALTVAYTIRFIYIIVPTKIKIALV